MLFEAGTALATHPTQTVLVVLGDQDLPSDLAGRHFVRLSGVAALRDLAQRLEDAGCPVERTGDHWLEFTGFPDRFGLPAEPRLGADDDARRDAYRELLAAHGALVQANSGSSVLEQAVIKARTLFDQAQSAVLVHGTSEAREAAEALRQAWRPRLHGRYMGSGWEGDVEGARRVFVNVITDG